MTKSPKISCMRFEILQKLNYSTCVPKKLLEAHILITMTGQESDAQNGVKLINTGHIQLFPWSQGPPV